MPDNTTSPIYKFIFYGMGEARFKIDTLIIILESGTGRYAT